MSPQTTVPERLYHIMGDVADRLNIRGTDPEGELAGRFGLRRFVQRYTSGNSDLEESPWLDLGARLRKEARDLSRMLQQASIEHFFFKGIALLGRFYRIDDRKLADIDLFIRYRDRATVLALLHARGYAELGDAGQWAPGVNRPGVTLFRADPTSGARQEDSLLDLHWGLEPISSVLTTESLTLPESVWTRATFLQGLAIPSDEHHAAMILHHLVRHDLAHVRGLLDFALLWEALPREGGQDLSMLAEHLGVGQALGVIGRVLVDEFHVFPLRGVRLGPRNWRGRIALRLMRIREWLAGEARRAHRTWAWHVTVTRSLAWRRFLFADRPRPGRLLQELVAPPREYLRWRSPAVGSDAAAWRHHLVAALRS